MRVFVTSESKRSAVDIQPDDTVKTIKAIVKSEFLDDTHDDKKEGKVLDLVYRGASLHDDWILQDIGINSGSTIKCELKLVQKPKLQVILGYTDEPLEIMDDIDPITTPISKIRSIISKQLGLPVSTFRLCLFTPQQPNSQRKIGQIQTDRAVELYDSNSLQNYGLEIGSTIKLEVWNGWTEFIRAALLGHDKLIDLYLSYFEPERHFQRRVALYIAAHFNYTSLAYAMLRKGARPDLPIGTHPTREWCNDSEHVDARKCAVHEACEQGNVDVLRILMKANVLCFVATDGKGRLPWAIVIEHFHKDCFEYLLARQWGRKSGKDGVSLPLLIYCRVLKWCERARNRVFIMHGAPKSTLRGKPFQNNALLGNGVAVDGLSNKTMYSIPMSALPKPLVHPRKILPALAKARRRFHRQKSPNAYNYSTRTRSVLSAKSNTRQSPSSAGSQRSSSSLTLPEDNMSHNGGVNPPRKGREKDNESLKSDWDRVTLPPITHKPQKGKTKEVAGVSTTTYDMFTSFKTGTTFSPKEPPIMESATPSSGPKTVTINGVKVKGIPLPFMSTPEFKKPYMYWGSDENPVEVTLSRFESYRGCSARENAIRCLTLADTFSKKPWLKRANMAACLARRGVTKNTSLVS